MRFYKTEAEALRNKSDGEWVVAVNGVYTLLTRDIYQKWLGRPNPCYKCQDREGRCHANCSKGYLEWASTRKAALVASGLEHGPASHYTGKVMADKADWRAKHKPSRFRCMAY